MKVIKPCNLTPGDVFIITQGIPSLAGDSEITGDVIAIDQNDHSLVFTVLKGKRY
jgi:hypothetical protein